ncbi:MAG: TCR/Tet family MFS transporter [Acetobacteraceae bacterium]|nr:TCR/Tet family MFS transporter [Acetobacteraceae bacterium]MBV8525812.1 TCR/Tet family MFS transporter [Acetobacteraceae bacterium]MBV8590374.1 TCR/Tet family MFS transporter [Acetobacteraceae bacterium]
MAGNQEIASRPALPVIFVLITLGIDAIGIGIVIPIVPELVRELGHLDASAASAWVGGLVATYAAAQVFAGPILGGLSDRFGRRPIILASVAGLGANYLLLAFAPTLSWLFVGRVLAGITGANVSASTAYIADITPPADRARRFGLIGAVFGCAFIVGPGIGGGLGAVDLRLPFLAAAGLAFCNFLYGLLILPESLPRERRRLFSWKRANPAGSFRALAADPGIARLALGWACMWFGLGALQSTFVLYTGLRFGWGPPNNGAALAAIGLSQAVVQGLLVRRIIVGLGERRAAMAGQACTAMAYAIYGSATRGWMMYPGIVVQALGAVANPAMRALISIRAGPDRQGEIQGALSSVEGVTAIISPVVASSLFGAFSAPGARPYMPGAGFYAAAALYLAALGCVRGVSLPNLGRDAEAPTHAPRAG